MCTWKECELEILYKKPWLPLADCKMAQAELRKAAGVSSSKPATMGENLPITGDRNWKRFGFGREQS